MAKRKILERVLDIYMTSANPQHYNPATYPKPYDGVKTFYVLKAEIGDKIATEYGCIQITQFLNSNKYKGRFVSRQGELGNDAYVIIADYSLNAINISKNFNQKV